MNLSCIKCLMFTKNTHIKKKREIDGKINFCSRCIDCAFKKFGTINEEELSYLLESLIMKQCYLIV